MYLMTYSNEDDEEMRSLIINTLSQLQDNN